MSRKIVRKLDKYNKSENKHGESQNKIEMQSDTIILLRQENRELREMVFTQSAIKETYKKTIEEYLNPNFISTNIASSYVQLKHAQKQKFVEFGKEILEQAALEYGCTPYLQYKVAMEHLEILCKLDINTIFHSRNDDNPTNRVVSLQRKELLKDAVAEYYGYKRYVTPINGECDPF